MDHKKYLCCIVMKIAYQISILSSENKPFVHSILVLADIFCTFISYCYVSPLFTLDIFTDNPKRIQCIKNQCVKEIYCEILSQFQ